MFSGAVTILLALCLCLSCHMLACAEVANSLITISRNAFLTKCWLGPLVSTTRPPLDPTQVGQLLDTQSTQVVVQLAILIDLKH